jgi:hypothetical protein
MTKTAPIDLIIAKNGPGSDEKFAPRTVEDDSERATFSISALMPIADTFFWSPAARRANERPADGRRRER